MSLYLFPRQAMQVKTQLASLHVSPRISCVYGRMLFHPARPVHYDILVQMTRWVEATIVYFVW